MRRSLGGHQIRSRLYAEQKDLFPFPGIERRLIGRPAHSLDVVLSKVIFIEFMHLLL
jgi:hypothetical protein